MNKIKPWTSVGGDLNTGTTEIFHLGRARAKAIADAHNTAIEKAIKATSREWLLAMAKRRRKGLR